MRDLFKSVANELIQQLTPEDLKEIMDSTVATVLNKMSPEQRLVFARDVVTSALTQLLDGLNAEQRQSLVESLLPAIFDQLGDEFESLSPEQIALLLRRD